MQSFRLRLPFFSSDAPSRPTSGSSATAPPQRPPFRPAGIAQPPKAALSPSLRDAAAPPETKSKGTLPGRSKNAQTGAEAVPPPPSGGAATSAHESKQSKSPSKKGELSKTEEPKEEKLSEESKQKNETALEKAEAANDRIAKIDTVKENKSALAPDADADADADAGRGNAEKTEEQRKKEPEKLAEQETNNVRDRHGTEDPTHRRIMRPLNAAIESVRGARELLETKIQGRKTKKERTEVQGSTGDFDIKRMMTSANPPESRRIAVDSHENPGEMNRKIKEDIKDVVNKLTSGESNQSNDENPISVVTLAGENKGAAMEIAQEKDKKDDSVHIHRGYRSNPDESPYATATDIEEQRGFRRKKTKKEENPIKTYINSNNQSVNNSIVFQGSVAEHDPGVHMSLSIEEAKKENGETENVETKKTETRVTPPEKMTYEPMVRRRCLRGLFAESSESEMENPQKPRRHGCRFRCKDKDIGIF